MKVREPPESVQLAVTGETRPLERNSRSTNRAGAKSLSRVSTTLTGSEVAGAMRETAGSSATEVAGPTAAVAKAELATGSSTRSLRATASTQ